jgi:uncharacterized protein (DUF1697 family)
VTYLALLRGINVGGKNVLPMKDLVQMFANAGCKDVRTYIQSGNVVFNAASTVVLGVPKTIAAGIEKRFGYRVPVMVRTLQQMTAILKANPFLAAGIDAKLLHVYFLADQPSESCCGSLDPNRSAPDAFHVHGQEIYLHLPNGMGRSKLTNAYFDSKLSTVSTARNWATVLKLREMMER